MFVFSFPGQGSQKIGMGLPLYQTFPAAKMIFEEIDEALKQNLSKLIFYGEETELRQTMNTQPALYAVSMAVLRTLEKEFQWNTFDKVGFVAGHSLGEYAALVCAGVLSLENGARLLRIRGQAMHEATQKTQGAMDAVLGLDKESIETFLASFPSKGICVIANDNCPGQVVLSGEKIILEAMRDELSKAGAKRVVPLSVSGAFHSPLMKSAEDILQKELESIPFQEPRIPVITNVSAQPAIHGEQLKEHLIQQVCAQVRWTETMAYIQKASPKVFVELGSGKILTGLWGRMNSDIPSASLELPQDIENFASTYI